MRRFFVSRLVYIVSAVAFVFVALGVVAAISVVVTGQNGIERVFAQVTNRTPAKPIIRFCPGGNCPALPPKAVCEDGVDNDSDGNVDYPADSGCSSAQDTDEANQLGGGSGVLEPPYPRIGGIYFYEMGTSPQANVPAEIWKHHDMMVIRSWYPEIAQNIRTAYPGMLLLATNNMIDGNSLNPSDSWLIKTVSGPCVGGWHTGQHPGDCMYNGTDFAPLVSIAEFGSPQQMRWSDYFAQMLATQKVDWSLFDGVFFDSWSSNLYWANNGSQADMNNDGSADGQSQVEQYTIEGNRKLIQKLRQKAPTSKIILAHEASVVEAEYLNGLGDEFWDGKSWQWKFDNYYRAFADSAVAPRVSLYEAEGSQTDYAFMRFGLTSASLTGAFFSMDNKSYHRFTFLYDEYLASLGNALGSAQRIAGRMGLYVRYFDNGAVITNGSGAPQSIKASDLVGGPYYRFRGGQDWQFNNGRQVTDTDPIQLAGSGDQGSLQTGDGILLVKQPNTTFVMDIIVDNIERNMTSPGSSPAQYAGTWNQVNPGTLNIDTTKAYGLFGLSNYDGTDISSMYAVTTEPGATVLYKPTIGIAGVYDVYEWHPDVSTAGDNKGNKTSCTSVPVTSVGSASCTFTSSTVVNQSTATAGKWNKLGSCTLPQGSGSGVRFAAPADCTMVSDAVKFAASFSTTLPPPDTTPPAFAPSGGFTAAPVTTSNLVTLSWNVTDNTALDFVEITRAPYSTGIGSVLGASDTRSFWGKLWDFLISPTAAAGTGTACDETSKAGCQWVIVKKELAPNQNQTSWQGSWSDTPSAGKWWYGIHAVDKAGNRKTEPTPPGPVLVEKIGSGGCPDSPQIVTIDANAPAGASSACPLTSGVSYTVTATGKYQHWFPATPNHWADAEYNTTTGGDTPAWTDTGGGGKYELLVNGNDGAWDSNNDGILGPYTTQHVYTQTITGTGAAVNFKIFDDYYPDNTGSITVSIQRNVGAVPSFVIATPANNSTVPSGVVLVDFSTENFTLGGEGQTHLHYYIDGETVPNMFYNGTTNEVLQGGSHTHRTHWHDASAVDIFGLPAGAHTVRFVLANADHSELSNTEAIKTLTFTVSAPASGEFTLEQVRTGLNYPARFVVAPDKRLIYAELKQGTVVNQPRIMAIAPGTGGQIGTGAITQLHKFTVYSGTGGWEERGIIGLALDPNFSSNGFIYAFYTVSQTANRLVRLSGGSNGVMQETILMDNLPAADVHNGGQIAFGPDGKLYVMMGDTNQSTSAQCLNSLTGKILRINVDGSIPADNPAPTAFQVPSSGQGCKTPHRNEIWAIGLRNSFDFVFHPHTNALWDSENGPNTDDEINKIVKGGNYGWPDVKGMGSNPLFINPLLAINPVIAPTGITVVGDTTSYPPEYHDNLFFADYINGKITRIQLSGANLDQLGTVTTAYTGGLGALIDMTTGPDGFVYVSTPTGIYRMKLNTPPQ